MFEYRIEDSLLPIAEGKEGLRGFGFETAFNEFYDLYASDNVLGKPILRVEDIVLHLYLRQYSYRDCRKMQVGRMTRVRPFQLLEIRRQDVPTTRVETLSSTVDIGLTKNKVGVLEMDLSRIEPHFHQPHRILPSKLHVR